MTATILILSLFPIYLIYGLMSSSNHLLRVNLGCFLGLVVTGIIMVIVRNIPSSHLIISITDWFNSMDNWITQNVLVDINVFFALVYFLIFGIVLIITRIILHYVFLGSNPANKAPHFIINRIINISVFLILNLSVMIYLISHFAPVVGFTDGLFEPLYSWVRANL